MGLVKFGVSNFLPPLFGLKKIAVLSFLISLVFVLIVPGFFEAYAHPHESFNGSFDRVEVSRSNWMEALSDLIKITELSIPGTHDSWAANNTPEPPIEADCGSLDSDFLCELVDFMEGFGVNPADEINPADLKELAQTQAWSLENQLKNGIRALDIRVRCAGSTACDFSLHHGSIFLDKNFRGDTLPVILKFLKEHPSEFIIMNLQEEASNSNVFASQMEDFLSQKADNQIFLKECLATLGIENDNLAIPLGGVNDGDDCNARGKLIIISANWDSSDSKFVIGKRSFFTNNDEREQNEFTITSKNPLEKWDLIDAHIDKSTQNPNDEKLWVNFLSASCGDDIFCQFDIDPFEEECFIIIGCIPVGLVDVDLKSDSTPAFFASGHTSRTSGERVELTDHFDDFEDLDDFDPLLPRDCEGGPSPFPTHCHVVQEGVNTLTYLCLTGKKIDHHIPFLLFPNRVDYVCSNQDEQFKGRLGLVFMDFANYGIVDAIVKTNDRFPIPYFLGPDIIQSRTNEFKFSTAIGSEINTNEQVIYEIDWGDGTSSQAGPSHLPVSVAHSFDRPGDHFITVKVTDSKGVSGGKIFKIILLDNDVRPFPLIFLPFPDNIADTVDTNPNFPSNEAMDDAKNNATVISRGTQEVNIIDEFHQNITPVCPEGMTIFPPSEFIFPGFDIPLPDEFKTVHCRAMPDLSECENFIGREGEIGKEEIDLDPFSSQLVCNEDIEESMCPRGIPILIDMEFSTCFDFAVCPPNTTLLDGLCFENSVLEKEEPGLFIGAEKLDAGDLSFSFSQDGKLEIIVIEPGPEAPAEVSLCKGSALLRIFSGDSAIVTCGSVTIEAVSGTVDADFKVRCKTHMTTLTPGQILTFDPKTWEYTNSGISEIIIKNPGFIPLPVGETQRIGSSCGGTDHEPPTIGKNLAGTKQMVNNGFCIDADCFTVTKLFHEEFKLYEMMSGTHTLSTLVYCAQGVGHCNYSAIGIMPYDKDMNDAVWKIEMKGNHLGEWTPVIYDPEGFLGEVTITTQIVNDKFLSVSYTIEFKNKQTPPMKVGVQLRDDKHGVRNFYFNEGIQLNDSDAYPYVETLFEESLKVEMPCINPQPHDRDSCGFELVRDWTQKKALDLLNDMQNGNYIYDKYVRDRYYD